MKQLMLQTDVENKVITTTKTRWGDVINEMDFVLAVGRNTRAAYIVRWRGGSASLESPEFWGVGGNTFDALWEMQHFYDLYTFNSLTAIETYMEEQGLTWGNGGN